MRNSNIECARFLSMAMIIVLHLTGFGIINHYLFTAVSLEGLSLILIRTLVGYGVNLFIFISGYYRIRLSWRSVSKLYFYVVFYQLLLLGIGMYIMNFEMGGVISCFFPFSHARYWFIQSYFMLMLLSPILNAAIEHVNWKMVLIPMAILVFYFGLLFRNPIDDNGFGYFNMVFVYCIAGYVSKCRMRRTIFYVRLWALALIFEFAVLYCRYFYNSPLGDSYNNPLNIACAALLFMIFASLTPRSNKWINHCALSVFAMYLIHSSSCIAPYLYNFITKQFEHYGLGFSIVMVLGLLCSIAVGSIVVDQVRIYMQQQTFNVIEKICATRKR